MFHLAVGRPHLDYTQKEFSVFLSALGFTEPHAYREVLEDTQERGCEKTPQEDKKGFGARKRYKSFFVWYNLVEMKTTPRRYYTPRQGKIPVFVSDFLSISDPVLAFDRFMEGIDLSKYLKNVPEYITGRNRYNPVDMLKTVLFAFADNGYCSLRKLEDNCKVNISVIERT